MRALSVSILALSSLAISGCVVRTAADIVTAPVKVASKGVDLATTSQSEADEKRGREIRKREEELGKLERRYAQEREACEAGDEAACQDAANTYEDIEELLPTIPAEPEDR